MSKCSYCHERKGKRPCPALGGHICSSCCGEHRLTRVSCPSDCAYLDANSAYQQKRAGERFAIERRDFYKSLFDLGGEPAAALFNLIEMMTYGYFYHRYDGEDGDVIAAVQSLRRTLSPLHIPSGPPPAFGERLKAEYQAFAKQQSERRQPGQPALDQQTTMEVLDRSVTFVNEVSGGALHSRKFLTSVIGYINTYHPEIAAHLSKEADEGGRIILPGQVPSGAIIPPGRFAPQSHESLHHHP